MRRSYLEQYRGAGRFGDFVWTALYSQGELEEGTPLWDDAYAEVGTDETFGEYLRRSFQWAGFPGFALLPDPQVERIRPLFEKMLPI